MTPAAQLQTLAGIGLILFAITLPWSAVAAGYLFARRRRDHP